MVWDEYLELKAEVDLVRAFRAMWTDASFPDADFAQLGKVSQDRGVEEMLQSPFLIGSFKVHNPAQCPEKSCRRETCFGVLDPVFHKVIRLQNSFSLFIILIYTL